MTDKAERNRATVACWSTSSAQRKLAGDDLLYDEDEDFDTLLAASSFGSAQARAIRDQVSDAAREHARRIVEGEELCEPLDGDIDDAVGELVYGMAHAVVPDPLPAGTEDKFLMCFDDLEEWFVGANRSRACTVLVVNVCSSNLLWPDHRASLLQALLDNDAFDGLRPDVAWRIVDTIFDVPRPPRVLNRCFDKVVHQLDVSGLATRWLEPVAEHRDVLSRLWCQAPSEREVLGRWVANAGPFGARYALEPPPRLPALMAAAASNLPALHPLGREDSGPLAPAAALWRDWVRARRTPSYIAIVALVSVLIATVVLRVSGVRSLLGLVDVALAAAAWLLRTTWLRRRRREERHIESTLR